MGRDTNEKITDGARGLYEKATGYVFFFFLDSRFAREGEGRNNKRQPNTVLRCSKNLDAKYSN
jgi:hypothetical protein